MIVTEGSIHSTSLVAGRSNNLEMEMSAAKKDRSTVSSQRKETNFVGSCPNFLPYPECPGIAMHCLSRSQLEAHGFESIHLNLCNRHLWFRSKARNLSTRNLTTSGA